MSDTKKTFFTIKCKTNMHVGSGMANYGVIDQLVQRDPTSHYPTIHASSLKGAIKEYCHHIKLQNMADIFGSDKDIEGKTNHDTSKVGSYKFFDANLLAIPVRCDKRAYVHVTCPSILKDLSEHLPTENTLRQGLKDLSKIFDISAYAFDKDLPLNKKLGGAILEDFDIKAESADDTRSALLTEEIRNLFGDDITIVRDDKFDRLVDDLHLPVIARNHLENGESQNLWYEQVIPRLTLFWSMCIHPANDNSLFGDKVLLNSETLVQIGANGSIGYGYCSFSTIKEE